MMKTRLYLMSVLIWGVSASASAQSSNCEIVLMPLGGSAAEGTFTDAEGFLDSVYDGEEGHLSSVADVPIRAVMCERGTLVPTMRDLPILKTGLPLSLSQDFDSNTSGLLTLYDAGKDFKAEYSGPKLSEDDEKELRSTLEIFNFQKFIK